MYPRACDTDIVHLGSVGPWATRGSGPLRGMKCHLQGAQAKFDSVGEVFADHKETAFLKCKLIVFNSVVTWVLLLQCVITGICTAFSATFL